MPSFIGRFQRLLVDGPVTPWFLRQPWGASFLQAVGLTLDTATDATYRMVRASRPLLCDVDALPEIARERGIRLYPTEPEESQRHRLAYWLQLHKSRGTHRGELLYLAPYFLPALPTMWIVHTSGSGVTTWHKLEANPTPADRFDLWNYSWSRSAVSWNWDGQWSKWSRFWLVVETDGTALDACARYDDGIATYDDGVTVYDGIAAQVAADLRAALEDWKSAHSALWGIILCRAGELGPAVAQYTSPDGWTALPNGQWDKLVDPSAGLNTRPPYIRFIYDRSNL